MSSRRARQRKKEGGRGWMGRAIGIVGILAFLGLVGGYIGVKRYLHSEGFRVLLSEEASRTLGISGQFSPFRWDGLQVDTSGFEASGEGPVAHLKADNLHTEIALGKVTKGVWQVRGANVGRINASLDLRSGKIKDDDKEAPVDEKTAEKKKNGWLPSEVELDGLTVQDLAVTAQLDSGTATLNGMQIKVEPAGAKNAYKAVIEGGRMTVPWKLVPRVEIDRVRLGYKNDEIFVTGGTATVGSKGRMNIEGEWSKLTGRHSFSGSVADLPCADLLSADWAKKLTGNVTSTFVLEGKGKESRAHGKLSIANGTLTGLPVLDKLAAYADTRRFRELPLSDAHVSWDWQQGTTTLTNLVLASDKLIRLEGSIVIAEDGTIDGNFRLGLAPGTLASIPGAETDVFLPGENGLVWTPLHLTGTLDDPKEDLSDRLMLAAGARMFEVLPQTGQQVLKFTQQVVGEDSNKLIEKGTQVLGKGVEGALKTGTDVLDKASKIPGKAGDIVGKATDAVDTVSGVLGGLLGEDPKPEPKKDPVPPVEKK